MARARKTPNEYSQERLLSEIAGAKETLVTLRQNRAKALQGHLPPPLEPEKYSAAEIARSLEVQAYVDEASAEIRRLEGELAKAWAHFSGLAETQGRVSVPEADLQAEIDALVARRRELDKKAGSFKEDMHDMLDQVLAFHAERVDALLASPLGAGEIRELAASWAWRDPSFAEALHQAVEERSWPVGTREGWRHEQATIARGISRRQAELQTASERA